MSNTTDTTAVFIAQLKQNEQPTAEIIDMHVSDTGPYQYAIAYLAGIDSSVQRDLELQEIVNGINADNAAKADRAAKAIYETAKQKAAEDHKAAVKAAAEAGEKAPKAPKVAQVKPQPFAKVSIASFKREIARIECARNAAAKQQFPEFEQPISDTDSEGRPTIKLKEPFRDKFPEVVSALRRPGMDVFMRGKLFVRPHTIETPGLKGTKTKSVEFFSIDEKFKLMLVLSQAANWLRFDKLADKWLPTDPHKDFCSAIVANAALAGLPQTTGITTIPVFRHDGSLVMDSGLDPVTGIFLEPDKTIGPLNIPDRPSRDDALAALKIICDELLVNYPFVEECHKSAAVSAMISPLARAAMETCPLHTFTAPKGRSGKTHLARLCGSLALQDEPPAEPRIKSEDEFRKRIDGWLLAGSLVRMIDNADGPFDSDYLNSVLTNRPMNLRVLGLTGSVRAINNTVFFATGNNLTPVGPMMGKTVESKINPNMARPENRKFNFDPIERLKADKARYLSAAYTIVRAHACAGFPGAGMVAPLASFGDWTQFVRGSLVWLELADPVGSQTSMHDNDPDETNLESLVAAWIEVIGVGVEVTTKDLFVKVRASAVDSVSLADALDDIAGDGRSTGGFPDIDVKKLGQWFEKMKDNTVEFEGETVGEGIKAPARRFKFVKAGKDTHTKRTKWAVEAITK